jgi:hypothetical protein
LRRVRGFLEDMKARGLLHDFTLLRNQAAAKDATILPFHADDPLSGQPAHERLV